MSTIWHLVLKEFQTQDKKFYIIFPLPLIFLYAGIRSSINIEFYAGMIFLMAYFLLLGNNHKQLDNNSSDPIIHSLPVTKHKILLAKYIIVIVWFIISVVFCNAVGVIYALYKGLDIELSSPTEIFFSFTILLLIAGIYYPLYYLFNKRFVYIHIFMITSIIVAGPVFLENASKITTQLPLLLLLISISVFSLSYWPSYLIFTRRKLI